MSHIEGLEEIIVDIEAKFMEVKEMVDRDVELLIDELYADAHDLEDVAVSFDPPATAPPHRHGAVASL